MYIIVDIKIIFVSIFDIKIIWVFKKNREKKIKQNYIYI